MLKGGHLALGENLIDDGWSFAVVLRLSLGYLLGDSRWGWWLLRVVLFQTGELLHSVMDELGLFGVVVVVADAHL